MRSIFALLASLLLALPACAQEAKPSVLIAYFTWAENTVIEDEAASLASALAHYDNMGDSQSGVDATSSASLLRHCCSSSIRLLFIRTAGHGMLMA